MLSSERETDHRYERLARVEKVDCSMRTNGDGEVCENRSELNRA